MIDWTSKDTKALKHPRWPLKILEEAEKAPLPQLSAHIWVPSSGTSSLKNWKWVALSKEAFLHSAKSVNEEFQITDQDSWLNVLPNYHVSGLSIQARCFCSKSQLIDKSEESWNVKNFLRDLKEKNIQWTSLVPSQIYDLFQEGERSPENLKGIFVGGGFLSPRLYKEMRRNNWPLLPTYGMTEVASQIATAPISSLKENKYPDLKILSHINLEIDSSNTLKIKSPSLFTGTFFLGDKRKFETFRKGDWFLTQDRGEIENKFVFVKGRSDNLVKIKGHFVDLEQIKRKILEHCPHEVEVFFEQTTSQEGIVAVTNIHSLKPVQKVIQMVNENLGSLEKIRYLYGISDRCNPEMERKFKGKIFTRGYKRDSLIS